MALKNLRTNIFYFLTIFFQLSFIYFIIIKQIWRVFSEEPSTIAFLSQIILCFIFMSVQWYTKYIQLIFYELISIVYIYGWIRFLLYLFFLVMISYVFIAICLDTFTNFMWEMLKRDLVDRFEESIVNVTEDREYFEYVTPHPLTQGKAPPYYLSKMYRFRNEDVQFTCEKDMVWFQRGRPYMQRDVWRRNGKPLPESGRFMFGLDFKELPENTNDLTKLAKLYGLKVHRITAKLEIRFLKSYDFGRYTCHLAEMAQHTFSEWLRSTQGAKSKSMSKTTSDEDVFIITPDNMKEVALKTNIEGLLTPSQEFELSEIRRNPKTIEVPSRAILSFRTSYWHLRSDDEPIYVEYLINSRPSDEICTDTFHGCSKLLLLYWMYLYEHQLNLFMPPFVLDYGVAFYPLSTKIPQFFQCLCEGAYGHHQIKYSRQFYNFRKKTYELVEAVHPLELTVLPREQKVLYMSFNRSAPRGLNDTHSLITGCPTKSEMYLIEKAARALESDYQLREGIFFIVAFLFAMVILCVTLKILIILNWYGRELFFNNSCVLKSRVQQIPRADRTRERNTPFSQTYYDFYVSFSDEDHDTVTRDILPTLETLGMKVCFRERDIPPNLPEIEAILTVIQNSKRIIVLLSPDLLADRFINNLEMRSICDVACNSLTLESTLLVIKLGDCEIPEWMKIFTIHEWSTFLPRNDHLLKLSRWVVSGTERGQRDTLADKMIMLIPRLFASLLYMGQRFIIRMCSEINYLPS